MLKRFLLLLGIAICCLPGAALCAEAPRVIVLPFDINAREAMNGVDVRISEMIAKNLAADGATIVAAGRAAEALLPGGRGHTLIRSLGEGEGVDHVVWGSLNRVGQKISLDAKMIASFSNAPPEVFFAEGVGVEDLASSVKRLSGNIAMKLFKRERIAKVMVAGNKRIEDDAVTRGIQSKAGGIYRAKTVTEDLKTIYAMGYFEDIRVSVEKDPRGKIVIFNVTEKPTIRSVRVSGNKIFEDEEILEALDLSTGAILNNHKVNANAKRIELLYTDKSYHNTTVSSKLRELVNNQVDVSFEIVEGEKIRIKSVVFEGNSAFAEKKLKKVIETAQKDWLSWVTGTGELKEEELAQDVGRLTVFYHDRGYIQARVAEPEVTYEGNWIYVLFKVAEGPKFTISTVDFSGDLIDDEEKLRAVTSAKAAEVYNRSKIQKDVQRIADIYSDKGYAKANVVPRVDKDMEAHTASVTYDITKGKQIYFEKIVISGNTRTRDKVIRRELKVYEQELYSGSLIKSGIRRLNRLDFFEEVKVDTLPGSADDKMILNIGVKEKSTGMFSFGGGYSSVDSLFLMASVTQRNLFGRGQILNLKAELGGSSNRYSVSFTEPWINDMPLSGTVELFKWEKEYDDYDKESTGGAIRLGYPVWKNTRAYAGYRYDNADISNIDDDAAKSIKELKGENLTSSVTASVKWDSRDKAFNPTEGSEHSFTVEYAGGFLGGDIAFTKYTLESGVYIPIWKELVGFIHGKGGYVQSNDEGILPDYERFYLGGINSIRGFDWQDIHSEDSDGDEIGGDKFIQFNFELIFPLISDVGLNGVVFFDTGNVFGRDEDFDIGTLRQTAGYGFRWYSPMGPIRLEYGHILDKEDDDEDDGRWEFAMGSSF